jgi:hypothetical protein
MKRAFRNALILLMTAAPLAVTQPAWAMHVLPVSGHNGDAGANPQCAPGTMLAGFAGHAGQWTDQIAIVCAKVQPNGMLGATLPVKDYFGGPGGAPVRATCPAGTRISSAKIILAPDLKELHNIEMQCIDAGGNQKLVSFGATNEDYDRSDRRGQVQQFCPQEQFVGATVRYGSDVNGFGFICDRR